MIESEHFEQLPVTTAKNKKNEQKESNFRIFGKRQTSHFKYLKLKSLDK